MEVIIFYSDFIPLKWKHACMSSQECSGQKEQMTDITVFTPHFYCLSAHLLFSGQHWFTLTVLLSVKKLCKLSVDCWLRTKLQTQS